LEDWELEMEGKRFLVYVFDVVEYNGQNLMELPLIERRKYILKIDIFREVEYKIVQYP
jgi:ATP-dependent DNA ligase